MSKPIFIWSSNLGAQRSIKPEVHPVKFGDGYEQRLATGVNFKPKKWQLSFSNPLAATQAILGFLEDRGGLESFVWVDAFGVTGTYVCREWSSVQSQRGFGVYDVTASFEQVYEF